MINRIIVFLILPMAVISMFLSLLGVQSVQFGNDYYIFLRNVARSFESWSFEIPSIPVIQKMQLGNVDSRGLILSVLISIGNFFVTIINGFIQIINFLITIINVLVKIVQFALTLVYQCKDFIAGLSNSIIAYV